MKNLIIIFVFTFISCKKGKNTFVQASSIGKDNRILVVTKGTFWGGSIGKEIRKYLGESMVGLPQPEPVFTLSQVDPMGFSKRLNVSRNILIVQKNNKKQFSVVQNKYAHPQTIIYITAKDKEGLVLQIKKYQKKIIKTFKLSDVKVIQQRFFKVKVKENKFKTLKKLGLSLTIPSSFRTVDDTGEFLWLRQHLKSGIARGDGSNNILVYSFPIKDISKIADNISILRDSIGKKYIPGSDKGMYMITEVAYTPFTKVDYLDDKNAYETRGKWEIKNDFMAGPFVNYTVVDKKKNRIIVVEGFTYAPSVDKRDFIFELEAVARSLHIK